MFLITMNISLASFQLPNITLLYLDPYNNTFGEEDWFVLFCTAILSILSIFLTFAMLGIVMFVKYGIEDTENRKLLDELISFAMITSIFMLLPASILMTHRNVFGPLPRGVHTWTYNFLPYYKTYNSKLISKKFPKKLKALLLDIHLRKGKLPGIQVL